MKLPLIPQSWKLDNGKQELNTALVSLVDEPSNITLSENMRAFTFEPKQTLLFVAKAFGGISVQSWIPVGTTIEIVSGTVTVTLTASTTPSFNEFYTTVTAPSLALMPQYILTVAQSIAQTLALTTVTNSYDIRLNSAFVNLEAMDYGERYNFTTFISSSPTIFMAATVNNNKYLTQGVIDYMGFANVYIGDETYNQNVKKELTNYIGKTLLNTSNNKATVAINSVSDYVSHILPIKLGNVSDGWFAMDEGKDHNNAIQKRYNSQGEVIKIMKPFFLEYGDGFRYTEDGTRKRMTTGQSKVTWCQLGAFDKLLPYNMQDYVWEAHKTDSFKWLTSCPQYKEVTNDSHEFIQCISTHTIIDRKFGIEIRPTFYDGTQSLVIKTKWSYKNIGGNLSFDVSPNAIDIKGIEILAGKNVKSYSIRLQWITLNGNVGYSELRNYTYDRNCYREQNRIIFVNEFGAWDSLNFNETESERMTRKVESFRRDLPFDANKKSSVSKEVTLLASLQAESLYNVNTGLLDFNTLQWSKRLLESTAVYIWDVKENAYRSIVIRSSDFNSDTVTTGGNLSLSYVYGTSNNVVQR